MKIFFEIYNYYRKIKKIYQVFFNYIKKYLGYFSQKSII